MAVWRGVAWRWWSYWAIDDHGIAQLIHSINKFMEMCVDCRYAERYIFSIECNRFRLTNLNGCLQLEAIVWFRACLSLSLLFYLCVKCVCAHMVSFLVSSFFLSPSCFLPLRSYNWFSISMSRLKFRTWQHSLNFTRTQLMRCACIHDFLIYLTIIIMLVIK